MTKLKEKSDPRGFTDWEHEPDEFDLQVSEQILAVVTDRVLSYRPKDKGEWAKKTERRVKRQRKAKVDE